MTNREKQVYEAIRANPMASQNELAEQLGLTRSAVSVYINGLFKKGKIKGRGYVLSETQQVLVLGAANLDLIGYVDRDQWSLLTFAHGKNVFSEDGSEIHSTYGGNGKNICEYLAR